jgi:Putative adhesin
MTTPTTVEYTARHAGPITLYVTTQAADVQIVADPRARGTWIQLSTPDRSGPAVEAIRTAEFRDSGDSVRLKLTEGSGGTVIRGNNVFQSGGMTIINGVVVGGGGGYASGGITVRAITEPGSTVVVKTMSGDVITKNIGAVRAETMSGDIEADGLTAASSLKSMSGDIRVAAGTGARPRVTASTMSGDVSGDGVVDLHASSMSGRVRGVAR